MDGTEIESTVTPNSNRVRKRQLSAFEYCFPHQSHT